MSQMCPSCNRDNPDGASSCSYCQEPLLGLLGVNTMLIGRYRAIRVLGCGGMGAVYLADDLRITSRQVAVKENLNTLPQAQAQFQTEVGLMAALRHPNLPAVSDQFRGPTGRQYMVMDYVAGETLEDLVTRRGSLPETEVTALTDQLLDVLEYLHGQGVVHRDVKPANVKLTPEGKPVLVDFGIAKVYVSGQATKTWARGVGSPGFAPIEQYGTGTDARSDLYSLGAVMYYLLTGRVPPAAPDLASGTPLTPPRNLRPDVTPEMQHFIFKAMALNPRQRYQSAAEMRQALRGVTAKGGPAAAATSTAIPGAIAPTSPGTQSVAVGSGTPPNSARGWLIGIIILAVLGVGGLWAAGTFQSPAAPVVAERAITVVAVPTAEVSSGGSARITAAPIPTERRSPTSEPMAATQAPTSPRPAANPIKVAILAPLSGAVPSFGVATRDGALLAIDEWNARGGVLGQKVVPIVEDSQCAPDHAVTAARKVIEQDKAKYIIGEVCSRASIPVSEIANAKKVLQISPTSTNTGVTVDNNGKTKDYIFRACFIDPFQGKIGAKFAADYLKARTAFILFDQANDYAKGLAEEFEKAFAVTGGKVVGRETYTARDTDFHAVLTRVMTAKPDVIYLPDYYNIANLVAKQAKEKGITAPFVGGDGWDSSDLDKKAVAGSYFTNHYAPDSITAESVAFQKAYGAAYKGAVPDALAALAYEATNLLLTAVQTAGVGIFSIIRGE